MRRPLFLVSVFIFIASSLLLPAAYAQSTADVHLTILHTNDTHGHLLPYSYPDTFEPESDVAKLAMRHDIGGAARRGTLVKRIRAESDHATLLIDAGDICDGTPFSTEYHGDADIAAMNAVGYDIACPGNHEYSNSLAQVHKMIANAKFTLISANSTVKADGKPLYTPYIVRNVDGVRIAFFGLMTYDAHSYQAARDGLEMEQPIECARRLVPELRKSADLVVAITHIGVDEDIKLAAEVPGIDLIVGGHSHTLLPHPIIVPHPSDTTPNSVHGTIIVQDFQWAGTLGRLDLILHHVSGGRTTIVRYSGKLLPITGGLPDDKDVAAVVSKFWNPISDKYGKVIGEAAGDFAEKGADLAEYNLVADAVREQFGVDFDLENLGGVRTTLTTGKITYGDLVTLDPFGNTVLTFHITGMQLKAILSAERPAVSGIRYVYENGRLTSAMIGDREIEDTKIYFGATNNYFALNTPGMKDIVDRKDTQKTRLDAVTAYIQKHSLIKPAYDGRRKLIGIGNFD